MRDWRTTDLQVGGSADGGLPTRALSSRASRPRSATSPLTSRHTSRRVSSARGGFTLVELIVAGVITALIGAATTMAVSNMVRAKGKSVARQQAFARGDAAGATIASDLAAAVRDADLTQSRVAVFDGGAGTNQRDGLLVLTRSMRTVRGDDAGPEGGEYEAQYRIAGSGSTAGLWRRVDPAFDRAQDGGGVASLLAPGVVSLSVEAYDGVSWFDVWDSDSDGLPHAVRVTIRAMSEDGSAEAVVRRVTALDRVPTPPETEDASTAPATGDDSGASAGGGSAGGGS